MANAMLEREEPKGTKRLYGSFWSKRTEERGRAMVQPSMPKEAIALSLTNLAEALDRKMTPTLFTSYAASLEDLRPEEIILAFSRAHDECRFFPSPAILREFSGRAVTGDPIASEAKDELLRILAAMRGPHGPKLKTILGRVLYGTEDDPKGPDGLRIMEPIRAESTPFLLSRRTEAALVRLGWGDRVAGIAVIADHPSLRRKHDADDERYQQNQLRASDEILKRFVDAYREV
jgi:hypothetical protein